MGGETVKRYTYKDSKIPEFTYGWCFPMCGYPVEVCSVGIHFVKLFLALLSEPTISSLAYTVTKLLRREDLKGSFATESGR